MWTWASMSPGATNRPSRSIDLLRPIAGSETGEARAGDSYGGLVDLTGKDVDEAGVLQKKVGGLISSRGGEEAPRVHVPL